METVAYTLESREDTVEVFLAPLERTTVFLDTCREDPALARRTLLLEGGSGDVRGDVERDLL